MFFMIDVIPLLLIIGFIIFGIAASELESTGLFLLGTSVFLAAIQFLGHVDVLGMITQHPVTIILVAVVYMILGGLHTLLIEYPRYLEKQKGSIKSTFNSYVERQSRRTGDIPTLDEFLKSTSNIWHPIQNKRKIMAMTFTWVFTVIWDILHKPVIWLYDNVYKMLSKWFVVVMEKTISKMINTNGDNL